MSNRHRLIAALVAAGVLAMPAVLCAEGEVTLNAPSEPLEDGAEFRFEAQISGPGAGGGCHWTVAEGGLRLEPWACETRVEPNGAFRFRAKGGTELRTLQIRATARRGGAFALATFQVRPRAEAKGPATGVPCGTTAKGRPEVIFTDLMNPRLPVWNTPFSRTGATPRKLNGITWDPSGDPAILALENLGNRAQVIRIGLDGHETVISRGVPDGDHLDEQSDSLAVLPGGDIVVADTRNHRICRLTREGTLTTLAGDGATVFNGDTDSEGRPLPAVQASLGWPSSVAVTAAGEVVFADWQHYRIRRFVPGGAIETLAGDGRAALQLSNDLTRRQPATACSFAFPDNLTAAPDGRIVFSLGGSHGILILYPDGTLGRARPICGTALITVSGDNAIVGWDGHQWLQRLAEEDEPVILAETRLLLKRLVPVPGRGLLALGWNQMDVWWFEPPKAGRRLADRVKEACTAALAGDLGRAAAIRASLARWTVTYPPSAETVRDHLLGARHGKSEVRFPVLPDDLQAEPYEWLRDAYRGTGIRARIALHELDQVLERKAPGMVERLRVLAGTD